MPCCPSQCQAKFTLAVLKNNSQFIRRGKLKRETKVHIHVGFYISMEEEDVRMPLFGVNNLLSPYNLPQYQKKRLLKKKKWGSTSCPSVDLVTYAFSSHVGNSSNFVCLQYLVHVGTN